MRYILGLRLTKAQIRVRDKRRPLRDNSDVKLQFPTTRRLDAEQDQNH